MSDYIQFVCNIKNVGYKIGT